MGTRETEVRQDGVMVALGNKGMTWSWPVSAQKIRKKMESSSTYVAQ